MMIPTLSQWDKIGSFLVRILILSTPQWLCDVLPRKNTLAWWRWCFFLLFNYGTSIVRQFWSWAWAHPSTVPFEWKWLVEWWKHQANRMWFTNWSIFQPELSQCRSLIDYVISAQFKLFRILVFDRHLFIKFRCISGTEWNIQWNIYMEMLVNNLELNRHERRMRKSCQNLMVAILWAAQRLKRQVLIGIIVVDDDSDCWHAPFSHIERIDSMTK